MRLVRPPNRSPPDRIVIGAAVKIEPLGYLGFLYGEAGEHGKAERAFRKATALSPHSEQASMGLFHSLWNTGKTDAAFDEMRRFIKSNDSPRYRQLIRGMPAETPGEAMNATDALVVA